VEREIAGGALIVVALLALAACTSGGARSPSVNGNNSAAPTPSAPEEPFVRTCQTSVYGDLGTGWRKRSLVVGSIASADRQHVALLYDPSAFKQVGGYNLADGETAVTFQACRKGESPYGVGGRTQFNGAFIVDGSRCATLEVSEQGGAPSLIPISFGAGPCG